MKTKFTVLVSSIQFQSIDKQIGFNYSGKDYSKLYVKSKAILGLINIEHMEKLDVYDDKIGITHYYEFSFDTQENLMLFQFKFL